MAQMRARLPDEQGVLSNMNDLSMSTRVPKPFEAHIRHLSEPLHNRTHD